MIKYRKNNKWGIKTFNLKQSEKLEDKIKKEMEKENQKINNDIETFDIDIIDIRTQIIIINSEQVKNVEVYYAII